MTRWRRGSPALRSMLSNGPGRARRDMCARLPFLGGGVAGPARALGSLLPYEAVVGDVRDHVATEVVARLGQKRAHAGAVQVVRERRAGDAAAHDEGVDSRGLHREQRRRRPAAYGAAARDGRRWTHQQRFGAKQAHQ